MEATRLKLAEAAKIEELKTSMTALLDNMPCLSFSKDVETGSTWPATRPSPSTPTRRTRTA